MRSTGNGKRRRASRGASLPPRWLFAVVALVLASLLGGAIWFQLSQRRRLMLQAETELQAISRLKADQIVEWRTERLGDTAVLASNPFFLDGVRRWLAGPKAADAEPILGWFRSLQEYGHYSDVLLVDAQARVRLSLGGRGGALRAEDAEALAASLQSGGALLTDLHAGPDGLPPHLDAIAPVFTGDGREPLGGLILRSDARQFLYPMLQTWPVPSRTAETLLIRRDGQDALFLNEPRHRSGSAFKLRIPLGREGVPPVEALVGKEGVFRGLDYRGVEVLSALRAVPGTSWHLEAKVDLAELSAGWRSNWLVISFLMCSLVAAAGVGAGLIGQRNAKAHYRALFQAEEALRKSAERSRAIMDNLLEGCQIIGYDWRYLYHNRMAEQQTRRPSGELMGRTMLEAFPGLESTSLFSALQRCMRDRAPKVLENEFAYPDGEKAWFQLAIQPVPEGLLIISLDITEHKRADEERERLQAMLAQAQKLESLGRLAGGVAHDFNNMLTVILGFAEHALAKLHPQEPLHRDLTEIRAAARRSAEVVNRLLVFSRHQTIAPKVLNLNERLTGLELLLRRMLGEDIDLRFELAPDLWPVSLDPSQLEQAVANLAVNSRDAMPDGGALTIESANVAFDQVYCGRHPGVQPGEYVLLAVSDNGCGMDKETLAHAFEPFFTTKPEGQGTGLGLSMVHGIVQQNGGFVNLYSEPGGGTTVKLYFQRYLGEAQSAASGPPAGAADRGQETILLVEDDEQVRELARMALEPLGYTVLAARGPQDALALCEGQQGPIHLLLTDVVMPAMNGKQLQAEVLALKPGVKVLFMSGYTANAIAHRGVFDKGIQFLQKPFSLQALARKVREVLDQG
jgi:PAS domain S-box-containing protein